MKAKKKGKVKGKGKAIIGIAIVAVIIASLFAMMVPISARDSVGRIEQGDVVYQGEHCLDVRLALRAFSGTFYGIADSTADGEIITVSDATDFDVPTTVDEGPYNKTSREGTIADIIVKEPEITADVLVAGDSMVDKSIPKGTVITIRASPNFGGILEQTVTSANPGNWGQIKIKRTDPDGVTITDRIFASATEIDTTYNTANWDTGTWKVKVSTDKDTCNELDISSSEYEFTIRKYELSIEAAEDTVCRGEPIILMVSGYPRYYYYLILTNVDVTAPPAIEYTYDVKVLDTAGDAYPATATPNLAAWIKTGSDGIADIKISTTGTDERTYTINVYDATTPAYPDFVPDYAVVSEDDDDVDVKVVKPAVAFDMPASAVIGEEVTIKGCISAGDRVDILIDNGDVAYFDDECVDENKDFEVKWDTMGLTPGSYRIDVYIDCPYDSYDEIETAGIDEDGSTAIWLVEPGLAAKQSRNVVAEGDAYTIEGTATGVDEVDIVLVGPEGYPAADPGLGVLNGLEITSSSVTYDNEFSEDITMKDGVDTGTWKTMILSPGRDGAYGHSYIGAGELASIPTAMFAGKSQDQIVALLKDYTIDLAGSDDLLVELTFDVETPYVRFDPIESVTIGEPLEITGKTNREPGTTIMISRFAGPAYLPPVITEVEWPTPYQGEFNATIDTTYAVAGTYTLEADDGDGNTDSADVQILSAVSIFDTGAGTYPSIFGTHNGTITPYYDLNVSKIYTYPCTGTGGHTEYVAFYNVTTGAEIANGTWSGYQGAGDYHYIEFDSPFVLQAKVTYNYTIKTGSYPQIIHAKSKDVTGGVINCTEFTDANGKKYDNWIPAIRLE